MHTSDSMYQNFTVAVICSQVLLSDPMKTDLEKVLKNKPHQQKAPKSHPVGGINRDDGGHTTGPWKDVQNAHAGRYNNSSVTRKRGTQSAHRCHLIRMNLFFEVTATSYM